jgi:hypothetical protein
MKDRYGIKLNKKQKTEKPTYWRLTNMLKRLRLKYRELEIGTPLFHIVVPTFGIAFRFNPLQPMGEYQGWDVLDVDVKHLEKNDIPFGENLMFLLISKGYMAYLRNNETGDSQIWHHFLVREGWGLKIINKRLELYNNEPRHKFMIDRNTRLRDMSLSYILTHYPDFFDYLW